MEVNVCVKTYLVESNDERRFTISQQPEGFERLRFQAVHDIHYQDGNVT